MNALREEIKDMISATIKEKLCSDADSVTTVSQSMTALDANAQYWSDLSNKVACSSHRALELQLKMAEEKVNIFLHEEALGLIKGIAHLQVFTPEPADIDGIQDVILQVQDGTVQRLRNKYGPKGSSGGKSSHQIWSTVGQQISRREHLFKDFKEEFNGDLESFVAYFTYLGNVKFEDILKHDKALKAEQDKDHYKGDDGQFSEEKWKAIWSNKHQWDIWYEINPEAKNWT
ncbi:hypothetical protein M422DRAFT_254303 [Sphaerobolus stellatus SS14]|uniref:Uncharacterized protein n=1 Tax=Sphaerobolus stellatus (strain SS14) TaxID=990650 RepID=A0A0C9VLC8_SPHS4|nr:hypothetical protein M422DRAFT_254303 [Sphaerobolus stellatus SS14]